jgi:DNA segregation ATPase FtsK/SpoIIIE-like protein
MEMRMKAFTEAGVRDIGSYQKSPKGMAIPYILIVTYVAFIDDEIRDALTVLTEQGLRAGIHNVVIVNRANRESLPQSLKSNIPARVVFRMSSAGESKAIDVPGSEKLEPSELIYKPNYGSAEKLKAVFTPEVNVKKVVEAVKSSSN